MPVKRADHSQGGRPVNAANSGLFAEDLDLRLAVFLVDVDRQVVQVGEHLVEILHLELVDVEINALLPQCLVHLIARVVGQQALELDARAQQLQRNADIDPGLLVMIACWFALDQDAQIFRRTEGSAPA